LAFTVFCPETLQLTFTPSLHETNVLTSAPTKYWMSTHFFSCTLGWGALRMVSSQWHGNSDRATYPFVLRPWVEVR